ncbi:hypothetical protein ACQKWADRAFT_277957 [Trichoderma austrokoningii]
MHIICCSVITNCLVGILTLPLSPTNVTITIIKPLPIAMIATKFFPIKSIIKIRRKKEHLKKKWRQRWNKKGEKAVLGVPTLTIRLSVCERTKSSRAGHNDRIQRRTVTARDRDNSRGLILVKYITY